MNAEDCAQDSAVESTERARQGDGSLDGAAVSRLRIFDRIGVLLAITVGLPSLLYPFGPDHAAFHYVASGWLEGAWPYLDAVDPNPPGIHALHALALLVLGPAEWPIRVLDLAGVVALGHAIPRLVGSGKARPGEAGAATLLLATSYYTIFDYADTARVELWAAAFVTFSWAVGRRSTAGAPVSATRLLCAGALAGAALAFAYSAALPVLTIGCLVAARRGSLRRALSGLASYLVGAALGLAAWLAPFVWQGAFPALWEVTAVFDLLYSRTLDGPRPPSVFWIDQAGFWVACVILVYGAGGVAATTALRHREAWVGTRLRCGVELGLALCAAWGSIAIQQTFQLHHHVVLLPFAIAALLWGLRTCFHARPARVVVATAVLTAAAIVLAPSWPTFDGSSPLRYLDHVPLALARVRLELGEQAYVRRVSRSRLEPEARGLGARIAEAAAPGEALCVLGYHPLVFVTSGLRCPSRFFVTRVLGGDAAGYRQGQWVEDYGKEIRAAPPQFFVAPDAEALARLEFPYREWLTGRHLSVFRRVEPEEVP